MEGSRTACQWWRYVFVDARVLQGGEVEGWNIRKPVGRAQRHCSA
jgi:hypothetical protein